MLYSEKLLQMLFDMHMVGFFDSALGTTNARKFAQAIQIEIMIIEFFVHGRGVDLFEQ
jgi:hypothetical protein